VLILISIAAALLALDWDDRENHCFDFRDLAAAARGSCRDAYSFGFDQLERPTIAFERRLFVRQ
jgi:hypothetical protein